MAVVVAFVAIVIGVTAVVAVAVIVVTLALVVFWDEVTKPFLEAILAFFGIKDEDVIETSVSTQRIIQDDDYFAGAISRLAIEHQNDPNTTVIEKLAQLNSVNKAKYDTYYNYGKDKTAAGLPTSNIRARSVDTEALVTIISGEEGISATLIDYRLGGPTKEEFVYFTLQNDYGYRPLTNLLTYSDGESYEVIDISYNYTSNVYDVTAAKYGDTTVDTYSVVTTSVVTGSPDDTVTVVTEDKVVTTDVYNGTVVEEITLISTVITYEGTGTVVASVVETLLSSTTTSEVVVQITFESPSFVPSEYYIVTYYSTLTADWKYWLYSPAEGIYSDLDLVNSYASALDILPVVVLRNSRVNTNSDKNSSKYIESKAMLDIIGLDIDSLTDSINSNPNISSVEDAFVHFSVNPTDYDPVVSKYLYGMFDTIYEDTGLLAEGGYSATVQEGPMNSAMVWSKQDQYVTAGILGGVDFYSHTVSGTTLTMHHQVTEEYYNTIVIHTLNSISLIDRGGLYGTVAPVLGQEDFSIFLSYEGARRLTAEEQGTLFVKSLRITFYSAVISTIQWYQSGVFAKFLQIVSIVIIVIVTILTWGASATFAGFLYAMIVNVGIAIGASLALKALYSATNNKFLRIVGTVVVAVIAAQAGSLNNTGQLLSASQLTQSVTTFGILFTSTTNYFNADTADVVAELDSVNRRSEEFADKAQVRFDTFEEASGSAEDSIDVSFVARLKNMTPIERHLSSGVDYMTYAARDIQYDFSKAFDVTASTHNFYDDKLRIAT